jgi:D-alanine-D-alanine ligase
VRHGESLVAGVLERMGFAFTGGGSDTLGLAQNKRRVKEILDAAAVPTPQWRVFDRPLTAGWDRFPAIVKAVHEHSSEGITSDAVVSDIAELADRIGFILEEYGQPALVEDFIDGREFHVSLWGNGTIEVLPVAEMDFSRFADIHDRLCTYDSKFVPGSVHYEGIETILPAALEDADRCELERVCLAAYTAVGCRDYGRIDVRVRDGVFNVLDVNPNADISADASLACSAQLAGYSYGDMASRIVRLAALRHPEWSSGIGA